MAGQRHSRAYHRYFENYAEKQETDANGKLTIVRVYTGQYYKSRQTDAEWRRSKFIHTVLFLVAAAAFVFAGLTAPVSAVWYAAIATMAALIGLILWAIPVACRWFVPREMEIRQWRDSSENLLRASAASGALLLACAAAYGIGILLEEAIAASSSLAQALCCALGGIAALAAHRLERRVEYEKLPPRHRRPEMSSPIRFEAPE